MKKLKKIIKKYGNKVGKLLLPIYIILNIIYVNVSCYLVMMKKISMYKFGHRYVSLLVLSAIILVLVVVLKRIKEKKFSLKITDIFIVLIVIFSIISTIFAINVEVALYGIGGRYEGLYVILYYLTIMLLSSYVDKKYHKLIIYSMLITGSVQAVYAFMQVARIGYVHRTYNYNDLWANGFITNPNFLATYMLVCLCYAMGLFIDNKKIIPTIINLLFIVIFTIALLITNTLSCFVGLVVVFIYLLMYSLVKNKNIKIIIITIVLMLSMFVLSNYNLTRVFKEFNKSTNEAKEIIGGNIDDNYGTSRIFIWKNTIEIVPKYIVHGVGIDNFYYAFGKSPLWKGRYLYDKAHNEYLQILITEGIFALLAYLGLYGLMTVRGIKNSYKDNEVYLILPVIGYLVQAFFNISVIEVAPIVYIALGMCLNREDAKDFVVKK